MIATSISIIFTGNAVERHGWVNPHLVMALLRAPHETKRPVFYDSVLGAQPFSKARNEVIRKFKEADTEWLLHESYPNPW